VGYSAAHGLQSRSRCRRSFTYLGFRGATSPFAKEPELPGPGVELGVPVGTGSRVALTLSTASLSSSSPDAPLCRSNSASREKIASSKPSLVLVAHLLRLLLHVRGTCRDGPPRLP
jgi:hypothetical protein